MNIYDLKDSLYEQLITRMWTDPFTAKSRTAEKLGHIDLGMIIPPIRAFLWYSVLPVLVYPISALYLFGYYRCVKTTITSASFKPKSPYEDRVFYGVQRRIYDPRVKRLHEYQVDSPQEIQHAIEITKGVRNQFIDDPSQPGVAYFVVEQKVVRTQAIFLAENYLYALLADVCRYLVPALMGIAFHKPAQRFVVDCKLWRQGRMHWRQVRHPILNFFSSYHDYGVAMRRINVARPMKKEPDLTKPKPRNPWSPSEE